MFLSENKAIALEIEDKIRAAHGLDFDLEKNLADNSLSDGGDSVLEG